MKIIKICLSIVGIFLFITCFSPLQFAQTADEMKKSVEFEQKAISAYKVKDFSNFLVYMLKANDLRPNHPRIIYNLGSAYALNSKPELALKQIQRLVKMGLFYSFEKDEDFISLYQLKKFNILKAKADLNKKPINISQKVFSINQKDLITEGIAFDQTKNRYFISSIHQRKILEIDENNKVSAFSKESDGLWSVLGMKVDEANQILWVCTTAFPQMRGYQKDDDGKSAIFKYDLKTGDLIKKYLLSNETQKHALGDLVINKNGDVFATDSLSPFIYTIDSKKDKIEIFLQNNFFASLQGLTFSPDEKYLFVADYSKGISKINMKTKKITQLLPKSNITVLGIDGLYYFDEDLIAIQNGVNPQRVLRLELNKNYSKISGFKVLESNHPNFNEPTLGLIIDREFYFIANSQWEYVNNKGELNLENLKEPVVLKLKL